MKIYTLKTCDTCKKALKWATEKGIAFDNHDVRADGLSRTEVESIVSTLGWEAALNKRSTTWRNLSDAEKDGLDAEKAIDLITANPTLMKRPVFVIGDKMIGGFDAKAQAALDGLV